MKIIKILQRVFSVLILSLICLAGPAYGQDEEPLTHFGQEVVLNGANIAWVNFGFDVGTENSTAEALRNEFQELASYGGNSARWWLHASGWFSPDINNDGFVRGISPNTDFGVSDEDMINQVREILDAAWDEGILLTISLFSYDMACGENNNINGSVFRGSRFDGMLNVYYQSYIDNVLTPLVTELRDHPALFAWEIFNEADGMSVDGNFFEFNCPLGSYPQTNETLQRFVNLSAAKIHSIDPNVKVTTSVSQTAFLDQYTNDVLTSQEFSDPTGTLDFYQAHWYWNFGHPSNPYIISAQDRNLDKPIVLGEFGFGTEPETQTLSENLSQALLTQGYAGAWLWDMLSLSETEVETVVSGASSFSPPIDKVAIEACISARTTSCYNSLLGEGPSSYTRIGSSGNDLLVGTDGADVINGLDGDDTIKGGLGDDVIDGGNGIDVAVYDGNRVDFSITETGGVVTVNTLSSASLNEGTDSLTNIEYLEFADGIFTVASVIADNVVEGTSGDDASIAGTTGADIIIGLDGNDFINASNGNDALFGGSGDDSLIGGSGADVVNGGDGTDQARFANSIAAVMINLTTGIATGGHAQGDLLSFIENLFGSAFGDILTGDSSNNELAGFNGNDILTGAGGTNTLIGGNGDDTFVGGDGADFFNGGAGFGDTVDYSGSDAAVEARLGGSQTFDGGFATGDSFQGIEDLIGSDFNDTLVGNVRANQLAGGAGNDTINGDRGTDTLLGGDGDDRLIGGLGRDTLDGGDGIDQARYANANSRAVVDLTTGEGFSGHSFGDTLISIENLFGSSFNDVFVGDSGDNVLDGGAGGVDRLTGREGNDTLIGGSGNDRFIFTDGWGADTITDFEPGGDLLDFRTVTDVDSQNDLLITNNSAGNAVISFGANTITLPGINAANINSGDFLF